MIRPESDIIVRNAAVVMSENWLFKNSAVPLIFVIFSYLYFVLKCGPRYMQNRPAYKLKTFIRYYNILQIVLNTWITYAVFKYGWSIDNLIYTITETNPELKAHLIQLIYVGWATLGLKIIDLIETGIFVLRKKQNQISFLHLYHHISTIWVAWMYAKYFSYELALTCIVLNCSIHTMMYTYYLLSSFGQKMATFLNPIKPYITRLQMVQFVIIIIYLIQAMVVGTSAIKIIAAISLLNVVINFSLFYNFYKKSYTKVKN